MTRNNYAEQPITHKGQTKLLRTWATELGLNYKTVQVRYIRGTRGAKLLAPTKSNPKPIDLKEYLGSELFAKLEAVASYWQVSHSTALRQVLEKHQIENRNIGT